MISSGSLGYLNPQFSIIMSYLLLQRRFMTVAEAAKLLSRKFPKEDPNFLREAKVVWYCKQVLTPSASPDIPSIHSQWKKLYNAQLHDSAYEEMADPGEQCDGELPSWQRDRKRVEEDKTVDIPSVSAHEATVRLKQNKN